VPLKITEAIVVGSTTCFRCRGVTSRAARDARLHAMHFYAYSWDFMHTHHADRPLQIDRRNAILRILRGGVVRRQSDLAQLLKRDGFEVTQSSVSRDLRELGVLKASGRYLVPPDEISRANGDFGALSQFVRTVPRPEFHHRDPHHHRARPAWPWRSTSRVAGSRRHNLGDDTSSCDGDSRHSTGSSID